MEQLSSQHGKQHGSRQQLMNSHACMRQMPHMCRSCHYSSARLLANSFGSSVSSYHIFRHRRRPQGTSPMIQLLPTEIIVLIYEALSLSDTVALASASRRLHEIAFEMLKVEQKTILDHLYTGSRMTEIESYVTLGYKVVTVYRMEKLWADSLRREELSQWHQYYFG